MTELERRANEMRRDIVSMIAEAGSGHPGGSLSCVDILAALYFGGVLEHDPADPQKAGRDRFFLAKGHAAPALYAALAQAGYFPREELSTLRKLGTPPAGPSRLQPAARRGSVHRVVGPGALHRRRHAPPAWRSTGTAAPCSRFWATASARKARCGRRPCSLPIAVWTT